MDNRRACLYDVDWQLLRYNLKGKPLEEKLQALDWYWGSHATTRAAYRIYNYLDALVRGGVQNEEVLDWRERLSTLNKGFPPSAFAEWSWAKVEWDLKDVSTATLRALNRDILSRSNMSREAAEFVALIIEEVNRRDQEGAGVVH